jgi:hypothetical protein
MSHSVNLLVEILYAEAIEAVKSCATLSASNPELISILGDINSEARLIPISEFFNTFRKIPNFDMIQYAEYYWYMI